MVVNIAGDDSIMAEPSESGRLLLLLLLRPVRSNSKLVAFLTTFLLDFVDWVLFASAFSKPLTGEEEEEENAGFDDEELITIVDWGRARSRIVAVLVAVVVDDRLSLLEGRR